MPEKKGAITRVAMSASKRSKIQPLEPSILEPDDLRTAVRRSLAMLPEADRPAMHHLLLTSLAKAGVNVGSALLMLGIPARQTDELTPSDIGKLLRYVRINQPEVIASLAEPLAQLLSAVTADPALMAQKARKAA